VTSHDPLSPCPHFYRLVRWCIALLVVGGCYGNEPPSIPDRAARPLIELLQDPHPDTRRVAAESLGKIGDPKTGIALIPLLADREARVREAAVKAIGRLGPSAGEEASQAVVDLLDDPNESVRRAVTIAIGELEPPTRVFVSVPELLTAREVSTRRSAARALSMIDARAWLPDLVKALQDPDAEVRQHVVAALAELGDPIIAPLLRDRLARDPSAAVRTEAAYRLGKIGDPDTKAVLAAVAGQDRDRGVRRWAQMSLDDARLSTDSGSMR
jgi:HEAT repeat protein